MKHIHTLIVFTLAWMLIYSAAEASTIIRNSVTVSAVGGESSLQVTTIHNGEVVESTNISTTSPLIYQRIYSSNNAMSAVHGTATISTAEGNVESVTTTSDENTIELMNRLIEIIQELLALLRAYESLQ